MKQTFFLLFLLAIGMVSADPGKTVRSFYSEPEIAAMRERWHQTETGKAELAGYREIAAPVMAMKLDDWALMILPPEVPRAFAVHLDGCPSCGDAVYQYGRWPWIITPERPFKVECPNCHRVFPDNDFGAYLRSGLADKNLLKGEYVDDGWGCRLPGKEKKYWFVAYYNHWTYHKLIRTTLVALAMCYLDSGDAAYADRAALILAKLAERWSDYDHNRQSRYATEFSPNYQGRVINAIWETVSIQAAARVYDAIFPALLTERPVLMEATGQSMAGLRHDIEEKLLRQAARDIMTPPFRVCGNFGMHQRSLLNVARVLNGVPGDPDRAAMVRFITSSVGPDSIGARMPLDYALTNNFFGDGVPYESPNYNFLWIAHLAAILDALQPLGLDYYRQNPHLREIFAWPQKLVVLGKFTPSLGDSGDLHAPRMMPDAATAASIFRAWPEPATAAALLEADPAGDRSGIELALFTKAQTLARQFDRRKLFQSSHLPGYGVALLQNGRPDRPAAMLLLHTPQLKHGHYDRLHLEFFSGEAPLSPDFGYPDTASDMDPRRFGYFSNTLTHNTVVVDAVRQSGDGAECRAFASGKFAHFIDAEAPQAYPGMARYRRSVLYFDRGDGEMTAVDFFRVEGGKQHDYFFHGSGPEVKTAIAFGPEKPGTLAGEDIPYGKFYDDPKLRDIETGSTSYRAYRGGGYQYLTRCRTASAATGPLAMLHPDPALKQGIVIHPVAPAADETLILAEGKTQLAEKSPKEVAYLIRRRQGETGLKSNFVTVFEPGRQESAIESITPIESDFAATLLKIRYRDGKTAYVFNALEPLPKSIEVDGGRFRGQAGVLLLDRNGQVEHAFVFNAGEITFKGETVVKAAPPFRARIGKLDCFGNRLALRSTVPETHQRPGNYLYSSRMAAPIAKIANKEVTLQNYSLLRGRARFRTYDPATGVGVLLPPPALIESGMALLTPDGREVIGKMKKGKRDAITLEGNRQHPALAVDPATGLSGEFLISELAPLEEVTIYDFAEK